MLDRLRCKSRLSFGHLSAIRFRLLFFQRRQFEPPIDVALLSCDPRLPFGIDASGPQLRELAPTRRCNLLVVTLSRGRIRMPDESNREPEAKPETARFRTR